MIKESLNYLADLVKFPSVSPSSAGSIEYMEQFLLSKSFKVKKLTLGQGAEKTDNIYAKLSSNNPGPHICFAGHTDVVPPGDIKLWGSDPFTLTRKEDKLYGRGTVDMKGAIACMMASVEHLISKKNFQKGSISFLITSDEEATGKYGTKELLKILDPKTEIPDIVILGEPTSENSIVDQIKIGRRGSVNFKLDIIGTQGHVAYPEKCQNPIHIISKILCDITSYEFQPTKYFSKTSPQITSVDTGNDVSNVVPSSTKARFNIRFNDLYSSATLIELIHSIISNHTDNYNLEYQVSSEPFIQEENQYFSDILETTRKFNNQVTYSTSGGTSDARFIHKYCPVVEMGLINDQAHKINEYTKVDHLEKLSSLYYDVLCRMLVL